MRRPFSDARWLVLGASLLLGCAAADELEHGIDLDLDQNDDGEALASTAAAVTAPPASFTSLQSLPSGMRLDFRASDPSIATVAIFRMDREQGYYLRHDGLPLQPSGQYVYNDATAILGHEYCYTIGTRATGQRQTTMSEARCAVHTGGSLPLPPTAPTGFHLDRAFERSLRFAFVDASGDETGFSVERRAGLSWTTVSTLAARAGTGSTVSFSIGDLDSEQSYCYRVRVSGASGSSVTGEQCGRTAALAVVDPVVADAPAIVTIVHPQPGALQVQWIDVPGTSEWDVQLLDGTTVVGTSRITDHTVPPSPRQALTIPSLPAGKLYCFVVKRNGGRVSRKLCEAARASRSSDDQRDPRPEQTPTITAVNAPRNGRLDVVIANPQPGQVIERIPAATGARETRSLAPGAVTSFTDSSGLADGATYCYRVWVFNEWGSRYGDIRCGTTSTSAPSGDLNLRLAAQEGADMTLDWDAVANADSYDFSFVGKAQGYTDHDDTSNLTSTSKTVHGYSPLTYCFKVRAKNAFGTTPWDELCGITVNQSNFSYGTALHQAAAGLVVYTHTFSPGGSPTAHLTSVHVAGNNFTPYAVRFLPAGSSSEDCEGDNTDGVIVNPGEDLTGDDLATLFGNDEPAAPFVLAACKMWRQPSQPNLDDMPIQVNYRR